MTHPIATAAALAAAKRRRGSRRVVAVFCALVVALFVVPFVAIAAIASVALNDDGSDDVGVVEGIGPRVLAAYQAAGGWCPGLNWIHLAAVGGVETDHGQAGGAQAATTTGEVRPWIFGSPLDGSGGRSATPIGQWGGWWGLTGPWQQAVGPMQFLASTFEAYAVDADRDGEANPHDIDDAVATAANYICTAAGGRVDGLGDIGAIYNPGGGGSYVDALGAEYHRIVEAVAAGAGAADTVVGPDGPISVVNVYGVEVNAAIAEQFRALVDAGRAAGLELATGSSGYRETERQIELRRSHCGSSHYAIYQAPASSCSPPTARPGSSMHEVGLAIDFHCNGSLIRSRSDPCFGWLTANAARYGLANLPSEPWHWSTTGG